MLLFSFSKQRIDNGISILVLAETDEDVTLGLLDKAFLLIKAHIKVADIVVWRPGSKSFDSVVLPNTKLQVSVIYIYIYNCIQTWNHFDW